MSDQPGASSTTTNQGILGRENRQPGHPGLDGHNRKCLVRTCHRLEQGNRGAMERKGGAKHWRKQRQVSGANIVLAINRVQGIAHAASGDAASKRFMPDCQPPGGGDSQHRE